MGLKIFRPNLSELTSLDVERCKRTWMTFNDIYEKEMKKGLVDGKRLSLKQFHALKNRDDSFRIYRTARQKLAQDERKREENTDEPKLRTTKITDEQYGIWMEEVKQEESQLLREARLKAEEKKVIRLQEAETRKHYNAKKVLLYVFMY